MLFVKYDIHAPIDEVRSSLSENDKIVADERFDTSKGYPRIHIKEKGEKIKIGCEFCGRARKDNAFLEGTYLLGKFFEKDGVTTLKGIILTAPIYHSILILLFAFFIYKCISLGGISIVPICLVIFSVFMFYDEFRKQKIIKRYVFRAFKNTFLRYSNKEKSERG